VIRLEIIIQVIILSSIIIFGEILRRKFIKKKIKKCSHQTLHNFQKLNLMDDKCVWCGKTVNEIIQL